MSGMFWLRLGYAVTAGTAVVLLTSAATQNDWSMMNTITLIVLVAGALMMAASLGDSQ